MVHLVRQRPLLIFAGSVLLLQLANAAMLPLMAGVVTTRSSQWAPVLIAALHYRAAGDRRPDLAVGRRARRRHGAGGRCC